MKQTRFFLWICFAWSLLVGCGKVEVVSLPDSSTLGNPRGYRMARVVTHYHSPYSYDACDHVGLKNGKINAACLQDLRTALCLNRVDYLFLSDHPDRMKNFEMSDLLLKKSKDQLIASRDGEVYLNQVGDCSSGFIPQIMVGFESRLLSLGMLRHLSTEISERGNLYGQESVDLRTRLMLETDAVVMIPHTESRSLEKIRSLSPDAIEIYNIHANLDPKIRKKDFGLPPLEHVSSFLSYLIDPYRNLHPDYMFMHFFDVNRVYFKKWNELVFDGRMKVAGFGGNDSHENSFPQKASDGERLDSHRRMTRFMSNHLVVRNLESTTIKSALKHGQGWLVFEGLGTPVGMDFSATQASEGIGVGETLRLHGGRATISVRRPWLHRETPQGEESPVIRLELRKVMPGGEDQLVAHSEESDISFQTSTPGAYRAEVWIKPRHLRELLTDFGNLADRDYRWIISNHLYLEP